MSVSNSNNNIRIRTTPLGSDKYVKINLSQNFDFLEILSLKIGQEQVYKKYCSDYGVIAGRVVCNGGVGVPNAKISVFIPISDEDNNNPLIRSRYPFSSVEDVDGNNIKYNLLLETPRQDDLCHRSVGSFPEKRRIIDCDPWCEIYEKYYKYTTSTNASGDYMIFGVPIGPQTIHMDVDLSDIGYLSQKPYDMVSQGSPTELFESLNQFKTSTNLQQLPQIKIQNKTINVAPFWGDLDQCEVGINRVDFDLNYRITPTAFFIGSIFGDQGKNSVNKNCMVRDDLGLNLQLVAGEGQVQAIRKTPEGGIEAYNVDGGRVIDENGVWVMQLPMNLENKITDEFGNLVDSGDPLVGISTKAKYRFKISLDDTGNVGRVRGRAKFLVPNYGDYTFDDNTPDTIVVNNVTYPNFAELEWNGLYTVKQFIARFNTRAAVNDDSYIGIKDVSNSGNVNPFPFNSTLSDAGFLFTFLCFLINFVLLPLISIVNVIISTINSILDVIDTLVFFLDIDDVPCITFSYENKSYCPGGFNCDDCEPDLFVAADALTNSLAVSLDIYKFHFIEDWINGTLFAFLFKVKARSNGGFKFCNVERNQYGDSYIKSYNCPGDCPTIGACDWCTVDSFENGLIYVDNDTQEFFYAAYAPGGGNKPWLFPTDIYILGSMKKCDILGKPFIVGALPLTTFDLPILNLEQRDQQTGVLDIGIESFLLNVNCAGVQHNFDQCKNTRRFCELGVSYDDDNGEHTLLDNRDISDESAEIRASLECLNVPFICNDCNNPPEGRFGVDRGSYRTGNYFTPPTENYQSDVNLCNPLYKGNNIRNSFYFYFGVNPGKTAIEKLVSQYFSPCERFEPCPIFISGKIENNFCIGGQRGSIFVTPKYGTPPYTFDWYKGYYILGSPNNVSLSLGNQGTTNLFSNLLSGTYTVVVTDSVGNKCKKTFNVLDPSPFKVLVEYSPFICKDNNNGFISLTIAGGNPPYYIDWSTGADVTIINSANTGVYLTDLSPTSQCTHTEIGSGGSPITNGVTSTVFNASTIPNGYGTSIFSYTNVPNRIKTVIPFRVETIASNYYSDTSYRFVAPTLGTYIFYVNLTISYSNSIIPNNTSVTWTIRLVKNGNIYFDLDTKTFTENDPTTGSFSLNISKTLILNNLDEIRVELWYSVDGITNNLQNPIVSFVTLNGSFGSPVQVFDATPTNFYRAIITDSSGQYGCPAFSALTIDITESCSLSVTATTIDDYCPTSNKSSITWGPIGGVPPFTYILESPTLNYYFNISSNNSSYTKQRLSASTCIGITYIATVIDSCGFTASTNVNLSKSTLRCLLYSDCQTLNFIYKQEVVVGYRFGIFPIYQDHYRQFKFNVFVGPANVTPTITSTCNPSNGWSTLYGGPNHPNTGNNYYRGTNQFGSGTLGPPSGVYDGTYCLGQYWYQLPPGLPDPSRVNSRLFLTFFDYIKGIAFYRYDVSATESEVEIVSYFVGNGDKITQNFEGRYRFCKNETLYIVSASAENFNSCSGPCTSTIRLPNCGQITTTHTCNN